MEPAERKEMLVQIRLLKQAIDEAAARHGPSPIMNELNALCARFDGLTIEADERDLVRSLYGEVLLLLVRNNLKYIRHGLDPTKHSATKSELQAGELCSEIRMRWTELCRGDDATS